MKKNIALCFVLFICLGANGQIEIGIRGGALLSSFDYKLETKSITTENIIRYQGGAQINAKIGNIIGFNTGLLYSAKGADVNGIFEKGKYKINYIDVPIMLETRLGAGNINTFLEAGAILSLAVNGTFDNGIGSPEKIKFGSGQNEISLTDYAASFGGGVNLSKLRIGLNYSMGLKNISNNSTRDIKNTSVQLYATLFF